ncbi:hypothetical protein RXV95_15550 [Novosphingobium sp. ZN18A2]|uniref:hypothetical protein n=1 Tax=Novosphingobium sp. ZN18A2 TaxID=3079861 RepID=UPI0030D5A647
MSANARFAIYALCALLVLAGMAMLNGGGGLVLIGIGLVLFASVVLEGRYRTGGAAQDVPPDRWQRTGEREIDSETGKPVEVWFDPVTGARRYRPLDHDPRR